MSITFRGAGTKATDGTSPFSVVVPLPSGLVQHDIVILVATTDNNANSTMSISANGSISNWTLLDNMPVSVTNGERLYVWWGRYSSGSTGPTVNATADHICAGTFAYAGCDRTSSVINAQVTGIEETSDTSFSFATGTNTTVDNCRVIVVYTSGADTNTGQANTPANTSLTDVQLRAEYQTSAGGGGGFAIADGLRAVAGTMGTWTDTMVSATTKSYVSFALRPPNAYSIAADRGVFTLTGGDANLLRGYKVAADYEQYFLVGRDVNFPRTYRIASDKGTYTLTGQNVNFSRGVFMQPNHGTYTLSGKSANLYFNRRVAADKGTYTLTGQSADLRKGWNPLSADKGTYTLSGQSVNLLRAYRLVSDKGEYTLTGMSANLLQNKRISADKGTYNLSGKDVNLFRSVHITADKGTYNLTGQDVNFQLAKKIFADQGSYVLSGQDVGLRADKIISADKGTYVLDGKSVDLIYQRKIVAEKGEYIINGQEANFTIAGGPQTPAKRFRRRIRGTLITGKEIS